MVLVLESHGKERHGMNITHLAIKQVLEILKLAKLISKNGGENHQMA